MRVCPTCNVAYPDDVQFCAKDGAVLDEGPVGALAETALGPGDVRDTPHSPPPEGVMEPDPFVGKTLGLYKIIEPLGRGGMGVVYLAEHVHLRKSFALKVLTRTVSKSRSAIERLKQEAVAASRIDHANIVDVVNFDETADGDVFIVMELLKGRSLGDVIKDGPLPLERALSVSIQIARALQAAHDKGIIHRDVKPENVFLCSREDAEVVKVLDFGISKVRDADAERVRMTKTGELVGTPLYMSPEQARGESTLDVRVDVYALGVILFEMLTGKPPFTGENYFQLLWKHSNEAAPRLSSSGLVPAMPAELDAVVDRALAKDPDQRYGSMRELHDALLAVAVASGFTWLSPVTRDSAATGSRFAVSIPAPPPRNRLPLLVGGLAVLSVAALVAFWRSPDPAPEDSTHGTAAAATRPDGPPDAPVVAPVDDPPTTPAKLPVGAPPPPTTPDPPRVAVALSSSPPGAEVFRGEHRVGETPVTERVPRSETALEYRFVLPGHQPAVETVVPTEDRILDVRLRARPRPGGNAPPPVGIKTSM